MRLGIDNPHLLDVRCLSAAHKGQAGLRLGGVEHHAPLLQRSSVDPADDRRSVRQTTADKQRRLGHPVAWIERRAPEP